MTKSNFNWLACLVGLLVPLTSQTAPGGLAQTPLFTATSSGGGVPSNIFFQLDDSGSMNWAYLTKKYWATCRYVPSTSTCGSTSLITDGNNIGNSDWRDNSSDMNIMYYNPNVTYVDWKKGDGTPFHATATNPDGNASLLTSSFTFEVWHDTHGYTGAMPDTKSGGSSVSKKVGTVITTTKHSAVNRSVGANGVVDYWDEHTTYTVPTTGNITQKEVTYTAGATPPAAFTLSSAPCPVSSNTSSATVVCANSNQLITITIKDTPILTTNTSAATSLTTGLYSPTLGRLRTLAEERQNIANWYKYYRTRLNVAKGAIGEVVDANPDYRYGLNTIWNTSFVEVPSKYDPVASTTARTDFITPNKALLSTLYGEATDGRTPLPNALDRVGKYFMHDATLNKADPIVYECQQNFAILFTDGYWNEDLSNASITDPDGDGVSKTLADVAKYYYDTDLSAFPDVVPTNSFDSNKKQHMVTYTVAFGLEGYLADHDKDGWPDYNTLTKSTGTWIESSDWGAAASGKEPENIDDLWHAAYNSRGLYISASSPEAISKGFQSILENISKRDYKGSATSASFNTSTLSGSNSVYLSQFSLISNIWSGDLLAFTLDPATGDISNSIKWRAANFLDKLTNPVTGRHIFTYNHKASTGATTPAAAKGVPFQWTALSNFTIPTAPVLSEAQKDLGTGISGTITAGTYTTPDPAALARWAYLRGDTSNDGTGTYKFRKRSFTDIAGTPHKNLLGDIIHSSPVLVSAPEGNWPSKAPFLAGTGPSAQYATFKSSNSTRTPMVYVGANDGMLHAFNADNGSEAMAYIPETLFSSGTANAGLHYLTNPGYTHRYYVDMPPVVGDVIINNKWRTVLLGGFMGGGRGIFALDITDPGIFTAENTTNAEKLALWEFNNDDDADMGYSFSVPSIAMMNNGRWAAVFGNGYYNNTDKAGNLGSNGGTPDSGGKEKDNQGNYSAGRATLFIVFLDGGLDGVWTYGTDYLKITAPEPDTSAANVDPTVTGPLTTHIDCSTANCNGLSTPQLVDTNLDRKIDRVYAGDLKGNMWAFNLSSPDTSKWQVAYGTTSTPAPLFTATYHKSAAPYIPSDPLHGGKNPVQVNTIRQPITSKPTLIRNQLGRGYPNLLVLFGTGQYLTLADTGTTQMQSFYGVWDHGVGSLTPHNLIEQTYLPGPFYDGTGNLIPDGSIRVMTKNTVTYRNANTTTDQGWFINLIKDAANPTVSAGERQIVDTDILDGKYLFFNTWIPGEKKTGTPNSCSTQGNASGSGFLMSINVFTGGAADQALFDLTGNGILDQGDKAKDDTGLHSVGGRAYATGLPGSSSFVKNIQYTPGTDSGADPGIGSGSAVVTESGLQRMNILPNSSNILRRRSWQELRKD